MSILSSFRRLGLRLRAKHTQASLNPTGLNPAASRTLSIFAHGKPISHDDLFKYSTGRYLTGEEEACRRRMVTFDLEELCAVVSSLSEHSPVRRIEKMEGGFSKALLMQMENGCEVVAKIPFAIAGPPKYTTAAEVAVLRYVKAYTSIPVPKVLAWSTDSSNPVGAEYIIMEKAPGAQLYQKWGSMNGHDQFILVKALSKLEGELTAIRFPASGGLYLRESLSSHDKFEPLELAADPAQQFCIGRSCDRQWYERLGGPKTPSHLDTGPWTTLPGFGEALVNRAIARAEQDSDLPAPNSWHGNYEEQVGILEILRTTMSRLDSKTMLGKVSRPVLWHTDLHMGNIFVSEEDPTKIVSIIDWQGIEVSPLFVQARFPEILTVGEEYSLGLDMPKLPENYQELDADDKKIADLKLEQAKITKAYELATGSQNIQAYKALYVPWFLKDLFTRCRDFPREGIASLRACLIEVSKGWNEAGFQGDCPFGFSDDELMRHHEQTQDFDRYMKIQKMAIELLCTDADGWISPQLDFAELQQRNKDLPRLIMDNSADFGMSPDEIQRIWPFP